MKKLLLLILPLLFIMSCEDDENGEDATLSIEGTWTITSVTSYENSNCSGQGETEDITGTATFTGTDATVTINQSYSFSTFCEESDGEMIGDTCSMEGGYFEFTLDDFAAICEYYGEGSLDDDNNCIMTWLDEYDYTFDLESGEYCETYYAGTDSSETDCGSAELTENSLTITLPEEDECFQINLSK